MFARPLSTRNLLGRDKHHCEIVSLQLQPSPPSWIRAWKTNAEAMPRTQSFHAMMRFSTHPLLKTIMKMSSYYENKEARAPSTLSAISFRNEARQATELTMPVLYTLHRIIMRRNAGTIRVYRSDQNRSVYLADQRQAPGDFSCAARVFSWLNPDQPVPFTWPSQITDLVAAMPIAYFLPGAEYWSAGASSACALTMTSAGIHAMLATESMEEAIAYSAGNHAPIGPQSIHAPGVVGSAYVAAAETQLSMQLGAMHTPACYISGTDGDCLRTSLVAWRQHLKRFGLKPKFWNFPKLGETWSLRQVLAVLQNNQAPLHVVVYTPDVLIPGNHFIPGLNPAHIFPGAAMASLVFITSRRQSNVAHWGLACFDDARECAAFASAPAPLVAVPAPAVVASSAAAAPPPPAPTAPSPPASAPAPVISAPTPLAIAAAPVPVPPAAPVQPVAGPAPVAAPPAASPAVSPPVVVAAVVAPAVAQPRDTPTLHTSGGVYARPATLPILDAPDRISGIRDWALALADRHAVKVLSALAMGLLFRQLCNRVTGYGSASWSGRARINILQAAAAGVYAAVHMFGAWPGPVGPMRVNGDPPVHHIAYLQTPSGTVHLGGHTSCSYSPLLTTSVTMSKVWSGRASMLDYVRYRLTTRFTNPIARHVLEWLGLWCYTERYYRPDGCKHDLVYRGCGPISPPSAWQAVQQHNARFTFTDRINDVSHEMLCVRRGLDVVYRVPAPVRENGYLYSFERVSDWRGDDDYREADFQPYRSLVSNAQEVRLELFNLDGDDMVTRIDGRVIRLDARNARVLISAAVAHCQSSCANDALQLAVARLAVCDALPPALVPALAHMLRLQFSSVNPVALEDLAKMGYGSRPPRMTKFHCPSCLSPTPEKFRWRGRMCQDCWNRWNRVSANPPYAILFGDLTHYTHEPRVYRPLHGFVHMQAIDARPKVKELRPDFMFEPGSEPIRVSAYGPYGVGILHMAQRPSRMRKTLANEAAAVLYRLGASSKRPDARWYAVLRNRVLPHLIRRRRVNPLPLFSSKVLEDDAIQGLVRGEHLPVLRAHAIDCDNAWLSSFKPERRRELYHAVYKVVAGLVKRDKPRVGKIFLKQEKEPNAPSLRNEGDIAKANPRTIVAVEDTTHTDAGPACKAYTCALHEDWSLYTHHAEEQEVLVDHGSSVIAELFIKGPCYNSLVYAGGLNPGQLDEWLVQFITVDASGGVHDMVECGQLLCFECDYSAFDATYSPEALQLALHVYTDYFGLGQLPGEDVIITTIQQWARVKAVTTSGARVGVKNINASGRDDTALMNALLNGIAQMGAWVDTLLDGRLATAATADVQWAISQVRIIVLGDDSLTLVPKHTKAGNVIDPERVTDRIEACGFVAKMVQRKNLREAVFLGRRPFYTPTGYKWGRTPGRALFKQHWKLVRNGHPFQWLKGVAQSVVTNEPHVPVLYHINKHVVEHLDHWCPGLPADPFAPSYTDVYFKRPDPPASMGYHEDLALVYGISKAEFDDFLLLLSCVRELPCQLDHPVIDKMVAVDA